MERKNNLTIYELIELYTKERNIKPENIKEIDAKNVREILDELKEKYNNIDINYIEKVRLIKNNETDLINELYEHYFSNMPQDEKISIKILDLQNLTDKKLVQSVRNKYPDLMKKYQEKFNERRDDKYEADSDNEFPIEVVLDMIEEEDIDIDIYKEFGYGFEGMEFGEKTIDKYFEKESV